MLSNVQRLMTGDARLNSQVEGSRFDAHARNEHNGAMLRSIIRSMRPQQWVKNAFVLAPLVFAEQALEPLLLTRAAIAFFLFSFAAGAVYLVNDCFDVEKDKAHPVKRLRPIPSGALPVPTAKRVAAVLSAIVVLGGLLLDWRVSLAAGSYLVLNLAYSRQLKHMVWLDVLTIAVGFVLRILAGAAAIAVPVSVWLVMCTFLLALYLGMGKRRHELIESEGQECRRRRVLEKYQLQHLNGAMFGTALLTVAAYTAYTLDARVGSFHSPMLPYTIPFIILGLTRFFLLSSATSSAASPTDRMVRDPFLLCVLAGWAGSMFYFIYGAS